MTNPLPVAGEQVTVLEPPQPMPGDAIRSAVERLKKLDRVDYLAVRKKEATALEIPMRELDKLVLPPDAIDDEPRSERNGRPLRPNEVEPWADEVAGAAMLNELSATFRGYIIMTPSQADAAALWAVHTHAMGACHYTPRLFITSPDKRCGKSQLLRVIGKTVARPLKAGNISSASFFRAIQAVRPTLLVDEFDAHKKDDEEMRSVINNGYERGNPVIRCDPNTFDALEFDTFAPCVIASIGKTWQTVEDRSITIRMQRKRPSEKVKQLRGDSAPELDRLASMAARWATDHIDAIKAANPEVPEALNDRAADIWTPLLAIADLAGDDWPKRARQSASVLSADGIAEDESLGTMLLTDLRAFLADHEGDTFTTRAITDYLGTLEERPWPAFAKARKPISPKQLADILKPFEVRSATRRDGNGTAKGYCRFDIEHAAERYLANSAVTRSQPAEIRQKSANSAVTNKDSVTDEKPRKVAEILSCDVVTGEMAVSASHIAVQADDDIPPPTEVPDGPWRNGL